MRKERLDAVRMTWKDELEKVSFDPLEFVSRRIENPEDVATLLGEGLTCLETAEELGYSESTISNYRRKLMGVTGRESHLKQVPQYERKQIPYEFETEIKMLSWRWGVYSFDEPTGETGRTMHERMASGFNSPVEDIIDMEEKDEREEFYTFLSSWIRNLPPRTAVIARKIMDGEDVTQEDVFRFKADALILFKQYQELNRPQHI